MKNKTETEIDVTAGTAASWTGLERRADERNKQFELDLKFVMDYARETLVPLAEENLVTELALGRWLLVYEDYLKGLYCVMDQSIDKEHETDFLDELEHGCRTEKCGPMVMLYASYEATVNCSLNMVREDVFGVVDKEPAETPAGLPS